MSILHKDSARMKKYFLYILECNNGSFYTGYTTDLERRYAEHVSGSHKCKYTRAYPPRCLAASWEFECELSFILRLEACIKKLSRREKEVLLTNTQLLYELI